MSTELRVRSQSQSEYNRARSAAWRNQIQLYDPSVWLVRDPEAEEKMLRDADIRHAIGMRRHMIAAHPWTLQARKESSAGAELSVEVGTELVECVRHLTDALLGLSRAFFSGSRFAKIHLEPKVMTIGDGKERTWLVPVRLEDLDKRGFRIVPNPQEKTASWERWDVWESMWKPETIDDARTTIRHVYEDDEASLGHGRALREALGWVWYTKTHVMQEWVQAVEKFAQGTIVAKVDGLRSADGALTNDVLMDNVVSTLEDMRARHVIAFDSKDEIEVLAGNADGWQLLETIEEKLRNSITTLVLGSPLPTTGAGGDGGSRALGAIQENSTETLVQHDRAILEETLTDDLLGCIWAKNKPNLLELGIADDKPRWIITPEAPGQDPKERAEVAAVLNSMGVDLTAADVYEQTGFAKPEDGEDIIAGAAPQPAGAGIGGLGGFGVEDFGAGVPR